MLMIGIDVAQALSRARPEAAPPPQHHAGVVVMRRAAMGAARTRGAGGRRCALFLMHRLLYTQQGLEFALAQLQRVQTARIEVRGARGVIAGALSFDRVVVDHAAVRVEADDVSGTPAFFGLLRGKLTVTDGSDRPGRGPHQGSRAATRNRDPLPARVVEHRGAGFRRAAGRRHAQDRQRLHAESVRGDLSMTRWRIDVDPVVVEDPAGRVTGNVFLRGTLPLGLRGEVSGRWRLPDEAHVSLLGPREGQARPARHRRVTDRTREARILRYRPRPQPRSARRGHAPRRRIRWFAMGTRGTTAAGQRFPLRRCAPRRDRRERHADLPDVRPGAATGARLRRDTRRACSTSWP